MVAAIGILSFLSVLCFFLYFYTREQERKRKLKSLFSTQTVQVRKQWKRSGGWFNRLIRMANEAGYEANSRLIVLVLLFLFVSGYLVGSILFMNPWFAVLTGGLTLYLPYSFLNTRIQKRQFRIRSQFGEMLEYWVNSMSAGLDLANAIISNLEQTPQPLKSILQKAVRRLEAGDTLLAALRHIEPYMGFQEYKRLFLLAVELSQAVGRERFTEVLRDISDMIKTKEKMYSTLLAYTAQGRYVSNLVLLAPYLAFAYLRFSVPDYYAPVMDDPKGQLMLFIVLLLPVAGKYFISRMVRVRVE